MLITVKMVVSISGYNPTKKFTSRRDETGIKYTNFRSCRRNYCWYGPATIIVYLPSLILLGEDNN